MSKRKEQLEAALVDAWAARLHYQQLAANAYGISKGSHWEEMVASREPLTRAAVEVLRAQARVSLIGRGLLDG